MSKFKNIFSKIGTRIIAIVGSLTLVLSFGMT